MSPNSNIGLSELISWKGQTFNQISSSIRKNGDIDPNLNITNNIFRKRGGLPLKLYRREINVPGSASCNERTSTSMHLMNTPGGTITNSAITDNVSGLVNTLDFNLTENTSERPGIIDSDCLVRQPYPPILINVGTSQSVNPLTITLPYSDMCVSATPVNSQEKSPGSGTYHDDIFTINLVGNQLTITNTINSTGWSQELVLKGWRGGVCDPAPIITESQVGNTQTNALRRLRSGGMIKKQFDISNDKQTYYTNTKQYIHSRNRSFDQNQYYYIRAGDATTSPGDSLSRNNLYSTNTLTDCKKFYNPTAVEFHYTWINEPTIDGNGNNTTPPATVLVTVPPGYYDITDINTVLHNTMIANAHYYRSRGNQTKIFLLDFTLNTTTNKIVLNVSPISTSIVSANNYGTALELDEFGFNPPVSWSTPTVPATPQFTITDPDIAGNNIDGYKPIKNKFMNIIGFAAGTYPVSNANSTDQSITGTNEPLIKQRYNRVFYKPNNPQFAQQGAVSSSSKIARKKYDAITNAASSYTTAYGLHVANALAYGVPANGYTIKDKLGYPNPNTPVVTKTGEMRFCR